MHLFQKGHDDKAKPQQERHNTLEEVCECCYQHLSMSIHFINIHQSRHGGILRDTSWRLDARGVVRCHGTAGCCRHSQGSTSAAQNIHSVQQSIDKQTRRPCMPDYNARND